MFKLIVRDWDGYVVECKCETFQDATELALQMYNECYKDARFEIQRIE